MVKQRYVPEHGDLVWIDFDPVRGHEEGGRRPAIVISPRVYNSRSGLVVVCPITSRIQGYPFEVAVGSDRIQGAVLADHVRSADWRTRRVKLIGRAQPAVVREVQDKLNELIA